MNSGVNRALVIGGGFSGMTAALQLSRQGVAVDLVEIDPGWRSYGAGISLHGSTLRVLRDLGLLERFLEEGYATDGVELRGPDDSVLAKLPTPRVAGPDIPGGGAIMRPALARILRDAVQKEKVDVRLGLSFTSIEQTLDAVTVDFTDGSQRSYDLVIGADGLYSQLREACFPKAPKPRFIGQSVWRAVLPKPDGIETVTMWMGPQLKVGVNRVTADSVYLFLTEDKPANDFIEPATFAETLRGLLNRFGAPTVRRIAETLSEDNQIVYRPLEQMLMPRPWSKGRVVLIGDAVHATTPHLAAGACIGIEDAVVLADEIARGTSVAQALAGFEARRWERCRMVVENSGRLADIETTGGSREEHAAIMRASMKTLAEAI
ncbi:FAD-dependent oxidoreductase [Ensifer aridi]|uniref:FAD-dependent oxidoreductase n=1 Tax=Ensifer aridi TaxID=1708715 RepID=UPI000A0F9E7C|nr:FAD-dependent oxidoreductase [Ensifer aridi]